MKLFRLAAFAAVVSLAACTSSPTSPARTDATNPSFDGGNTLGSGHYSGEGPGTFGSGDHTEGAASDTTSTEPRRGGGGLGSGN